MRKSFPKSLLLLVVTFASIGAFFAYSLADNAPVTGSYGVTHSTGIFLTGGNAGTISFDATPLGYSGAQVYKAGINVYLTGIFWMQTVGWLSFAESPLELMAPSENVRDPWSLSGYVWSPNAGWIIFNHGESYASGVYFLPDTGLLVGHAWSDSLGWIPFGSTTSSGVQIATNEGFIGKVAVTGQIGGSKTFNVLYEVGGRFNTTSMTSFLNVIRKNVLILMRNAGTKINTSLAALGSAVSFNGAMMFRIESNPGEDFLSYSQIQTTYNNDLARSLIAVGTDIYIDTDVLTPPGLTQVRAILALKNDAGQGGHIWIRGDVKKIEALLFAEGTIWSGQDAGGGLGLTPYYVRKESLFTDMPTNQLYIKGAVGSHNTIGGGSKDGGAICPYLSDVAVTCDYDNAITYDWNYFRIFRSGDTPRRAYPDDSKDGFSVIVEYDPRIIQDPPPGLYQVFN